MHTSTIELRKSLGEAAGSARRWFEVRAELKSRATFDTRGGLGDSGVGAVYVYFAADRTALYVGETGRNVKSRLHDETSPHKKKCWWSEWTEMCFAQVADRTDRFVIELLLILAYSPKHNEKPKAKTLEDLLPT